MNNRKLTKGRKFRYVTIDGKQKKIDITSASQELAFKAQFERMLKLNRTYSCSEKTTIRKQERNRSVLIWNSKESGTFIGSVKKELMHN